MGTIKTNSKEFNALVYTYILDAINTDGYDIEVNTDQEKLQFLADCFKSEYVFPDNLKRYGSYQNLLENWFMGLPSSFSIDFTNDDILTIAKKWGSLPANSTDNQDWKVLNNWFKLIAFKTMQLFSRHNINFN